MPLERLNEHLCVDRKPQSHFYVKSLSEGKYYRDPVLEYSGYQYLKEFYNMPRVRLAQTSLGELLVIKGVNAESASNLLETFPDKVAIGLKQFIADTLQLWSQTIRPMDSSQLARNWRTESLSMIRRIKDDRRYQSFSSKRLEVNGTIYPSISETLNLCQRNLFNNDEDSMALCHGDEHLGNILVGENQVWVIDPGNYTGFNSLSSTINNLIGGTYLFEYQYIGAVNENSTNLRIDYSLDNRFKQAEQLLSPVFKEFAGIVGDVLGSNNYLSEFLFTNELRVAMGWTNRRMDLSKILGNGLLYAGMATEHFYSKNII